MKKLSIILLVLVVLAAGALLGCKREGGTATAAKAEGAAGKVIKNPDTMIYAAYGTVDSMDPAKAYDNASGGCIQNSYECLLDFKGSSTTEFVPVLATKVPTTQNGLISNGGKTYKFPIRKGVKFHSGNKLTPEVVAYSFKRHLVTDCEGGPVWMLFEPLFGTYASRDDDGNITVNLADLDKAIQVQGDSVVFNLKQPFAPFMSILAFYATAIIDKDFAIANGDWKGTQEDIARVNRPEAGKEPLTSIASGTGPYKLVRIDKSSEVVWERFDDYWGKKPSMAKAIYKIVEEWSTRKLLLLQGDVDFGRVDPMYYAEMDQEPGLEVYKGMVELSNRGINFNMKIAATDNPYIYSGKLDGRGVPPDFFSDKAVRLAFTCAFDKETYLRDINKGFGIPAETPIPSGMPYFNAELKAIPYDMKKAEEYFKQAWGGQLWQKGFQLDLTFNTGNEVREQTMKMLAESIMSLNPKFKLTVRGVEWATFVNQQNKKMLPIFYIGWGADYPDPHNFVQPYMHSEGLFANRCGYNNPEVDKLVEEGVLETDPAKRQTMYYRLQDIWLEDNIGIMLHQPIIQHYFKDWVQGYYFHPMENYPNWFKMYSKGY
jgi:peptide/nickel transport system substrate-binding protein